MSLYKKGPCLICDILAVFIYHNGMMLDIPIQQIRRYVEALCDPKSLVVSACRTKIEEDMEALLSPIQILYSRIKVNRGGCPTLPTLSSAHTEKLDDLARHVLIRLIRLNSSTRFLTSNNTKIYRNDPKYDPTKEFYIEKRIPNNDNARV